jgi:hypothetical protein
LAFLFLVGLSPQGFAQRAGTGEDGASLSVYLVTMGPGTRVWERFAHNALWVRDTTGGIDRVYNYGMFSFEQENFLIRFVRGEMLYWMEGFDGRRHNRAYAAADRSVWIQELNLTPAQRAELYAFLQWNDQPQNRFYRYDYYLDNCSSRVRDALDRVLDGRLRDLWVDAATGSTFRFHTRRLLAPDLGAYFGTLWSLGHPVDRPISVWEETFLPVPLMIRLRDVTVLDGAGNAAPLVLSEATLYESTQPPEAETAPNWLVQFLLAGMLLAAVIYFLGANARVFRWAQVLSTVAVSLWGLLLGLGGVFIVAVWIFTAHWAAYLNENLFFTNPIALPLVVLVPLAARGKTWAARWACWVAFAVAGLSLLGLAIQVLPWFDQVNGEVIALALPPTLAMWWVVERQELP